MASTDHDYRHISVDLQRLQERFSAFQQRLREQPPAAGGATPRELVYRRGGLCLYRYGDGSGVPLLVVFALINRPGILDLHHDRSFIARLTGQGVDTYLIEWSDPGPDDAGLELSHYVTENLCDCVDEVRRCSGRSRVDLLGVCQGGVLSLLFTALFPQRVRRLVTMVTPVDFHTADNVLANLIAHVDVDRLVERFGNVPGWLLARAFIALRPLSLGAGKYLELVEKNPDDEELAAFVKMERWIHDGPDLAGLAVLQFVQLFFRDNVLLHGPFRFGAERIDLACVRQPLLNVFALHDKLVPPDASRALAGVTGSADYSELVVNAGHIGVYVSRRRREPVPESIAAWLQRD